MSIRTSPMSKQLQLLIVSRLVSHTGLAEGDEREFSRRTLEVRKGSSLEGEAGSMILQTGRGAFRFG